MRGIAALLAAALLCVLLPIFRPAPLDPAVMHEWAAWDLHGILDRSLDVEAAFRLVPLPAPRAHAG